MYPEHSLKLSMPFNSTVTKKMLSEMKAGWFIGDFDPSLHKTQAVEVAVKYYEKGTKEKKHYHAQAKEFTVIASGKAKINDVYYETGEIAVVPPNTPTAFEAVTDVITTVVKLPSSRNDKYILEDD